MCGINGVLAFANGTFSVSERYVSQMRDTMAHRGPDGASSWVDTECRVGLGHRRLSIIDLSDCAAQPMSNEDGTLWITYNGEIYNHRELRAELSRSGRHRWKTNHSDTEVILHAFEEWGIDCLSRFRGMFAFGLWDANARELWLVRDRVGIRKLAPATWMRVGADGQITDRRYWDVFDEVEALDGLGEDEIAERLVAELRTAVKLRKVSDVPVGVFLSGGLDSSTNAVLFSEGESAPVETFSIAYADTYRSYPSELEYARSMAARVGANHHEYLVRAQDVIDFLPLMARLQDEPIGDPVCVPLYYVAKLARAHGVV